MKETERGGTNRVPGPDDVTGTERDASAGSRRADGSPLSGSRDDGPGSGPDGTAGRGPKIGAASERNDGQGFGTDTDAESGRDNRPRDILQRIPFFAELDREELDELADAVVIARYRRNQVLFVEGEPSRSLYFICSGRVKVYRLSDDGREQILHLLSDGDPIAVVPFFDGGAYPANAEVMADSEIAFLRADDFERIARANPTILLRMLRILAQRLRRAQDDIASLALKDVSGRLADALLELARRQGEQVQGHIQFHLQLSRQELGNLIGATRETTTRLLHQFQRDKAIRIDGPVITILDKRRLHEWSRQ